MQRPLINKTRLLPKTAQLLPRSQSASATCSVKARTCLKKLSKSRDPTLASFPSADLARLYFSHGPGAVSSPYLQIFPACLGVLQKLKKTGNDSTGQRGSDLRDLKGCTGLYAARKRGSRLASRGECLCDHLLGFKKDLFKPFSSRSIFTGSELWQQCKSTKKNHPKMPRCSCRPSAGIPRAQQAAWGGGHTPAGPVPPPSGEPPESPMKSSYSINKPRRGKFRLQDPFGCEGGDQCCVLHGLALLSPQNLEFKVLH